MKYPILFIALFAALGSRAQTSGDVALAEVSMVMPGEPVVKPSPVKNNVVLHSRKEKGTVVVVSHRKQDVKIYVFDVDGAILYQSTLQQNKKQKIESLAKGTYSYSIFDGDTSIEEGSLVIK